MEQCSAKSLMISVFCGNCGETFGGAFEICIVVVRRDFRAVFFKCFQILENRNSENRFKIGL